MIPCYIVSVALYLLALSFNAFMRRTPHNAECRLGNSVTAFFRALGTLVSHRRLGRILLGCAVFWFAGAALRNNLQGWGLELFRAVGITEITNEKLALLKALLVVGIVAGSMLAGQLHKIGDLSWTRRYGVLMAASILGLGLCQASLGLWGAGTLLLVTGVFAGLLIVPLNAALQSECDQGSLGKTVAVQNFCDYAAMLVGAGFLGALSHLGQDPARMFVWLAVALALIAVALRMPSLVERLRK